MMKMSVKCAEIAAVHLKKNKQHKHIYKPDVVQNILLETLCCCYFLQCQMDSFRLVKYKMSYGRASCRAPNMLLRKRHNAAPGMVVVSKK